MSRSYFDAVAAQPLHPSAAVALARSASIDWADPAANYYEASSARRILDASRETVAAVLGIGAERVVFRRAGPDAASLAVDLASGAAWTRADSEGSAVASAVERRPILDAMASRGALRTIPVDDTARVRVGAAEMEIAQEPAFVAVQMANIEFGTLQPTAQVARMCRDVDVPLLMDATGALGLVEIPPEWDVLVAGARGWAGPRDAAVVALPAGGGRRVPDTIGLPGIVATAAALDAVRREAHRKVPTLRGMSERVLSLIDSQLPDAVVLGSRDHRLPQIVAMLLPRVDATLLQSELDRVGIAVGSGSACADERGRPSHVLEASGQPTHGNIRISLPWGTTDADLDNLVANLPIAVARAEERTRTG